MIRRAGTGAPAGRRGRKRGQSLVELCLAMPLMLLLLLGAIDVGRVFYYTIQMHNAVREGAGYGAHNPTDTAGMASRVTAEASFVSSVSAICNGTCTGTNGQISGNPTVTVSATYTFTPITTGFLQKYFGMKPIALKASSTMNVLQ